jgi:hypothetical protein
MVVGCSDVSEMKTLRGARLVVLQAKEILGDAGVAGEKNKSKLSSTPALMEVFLLVPWV